WINVDLDIIACESCGARLLFSTPFSWSQPQVEKAALVFSLKLDSGHKSSCPWVDNACDEKLAKFPPTADQNLVNDYKQRKLALSELLALPLISKSAISHLESPQFEHFIQNEPVSECDDRFVDELKTSYLGNDYTESAKKYYEAQKIISLFGWEPRSLPYVVDCENQSAPLPNTATHLNFRQFSGGHKISVDSNPQDTTETENDFDVCSGVRLDPNSVVLECKVCGASVGLWAFSKIPRPMEFHRLVGYSEVNGQRESEVTTPSNDKSGNKIHNTASWSGAIGSPDHVKVPKDHPTNLNLTIAGGPPPTKQSFRAKISLPSIGHNLRARLFADCGLRIQEPTNQEIAQSDPGNEHGLGIPEPTNQEIAQSDPGNEREHITSSVQNQATEATDPQQVMVTFESHDSTIGERVENVSMGPNTSTHKKNIREKDSVEYLPSIPDKLCCNSSAMGLKPSTHEKTIEFDPLWQHRHFCPWIASVSNSSPGWKLVLSALHRQNGSPLSFLHDSTSSSKFIEVDDPLSSIRRLFASPSPEGKKLTRKVV
uniref:C3HC-type domain-containing protein n=1 Tax=Kalanchoe fedtschenkoi TaxID=63787 RepID=A0A7N0RBT2_KALFE